MDGRRNDSDPVGVELRMERSGSSEKAETMENREEESSWKDCLPKDTDRRLSSSLKDLGSGEAVDMRRVTWSGRGAVAGAGVREEEREGRSFNV